MGQQEKLENKMAICQAMDGQAKKRDVHGGSKASREQDLAAGVRKGREAQLYHAMNSGKERKQLEAKIGRAHV